MWSRIRQRPELEDFVPNEDTAKYKIQEKIERNRTLIDRALRTDLDPSVLSMMVYSIKEKNDRLIEQLKTLDYE